MSTASRPSTAELISAAKEGRSGLLALIGNTPLVPLKKINPNPRVELYGKLECFNPGGSVKDRIAVAMIEHAERAGQLAPGKTILEATSGNTGIGLAMVAAVKGYRILLAMSEGVSLERRKILSALGADFLLTPANLGTDGAIEVAYDLAAKEPDRYYLTDQYNNEANILAHYHGTALEIWQQTEHRVTHFVGTLGTTGTLMGTSRRLRELNPGIEILGVEPYLGHRIQGLKNMKEAYRPGIYERRLLTQKINVEDDAAFARARQIARQEGLLVGMSAGAAVHVAAEVARTLDSGVIVALLPDGGERYLSTLLFQVPQDVERSTVELQFFNSFAKRKEVFKPNDPQQVTMYVCGPTANALPHLGLYRRIIVADLVRRTVEVSGFPVRLVMNVTDIDDRTLDAAKSSDTPLKQLTEEITTQLMEDLDTLGVKPATVYPRASEHVDEMIALTRELVESGHAYEKLKSVYFNIEKSPRYGELSGIDLDKIHVGATVDLDSYDKDDPRDFTLLKRSTLDEIKRGVSYKTEWGNVRPGWHIECAAMSLSLAGEEMDIHLGGVEHVFPHHENEIAIYRAVCNKQGANYWLHSGMVMTEGRIMSRSAGNSVTVRDLLERGYTGEQIRFYLLSKHYRQPFGYSEEELSVACGAHKRIVDCVHNLRRVTGGEGHKDTDEVIAEFDKGFREALYDDLNVSGAYAALFRFVRLINRRLARAAVGRPDAEAMLAAIDRADAVLNVIPPPPPDAVEAEEAIAKLAREREEARRAKDFARADDLRQEIEDHGVVLEDTPQGPRWRPR